jgi:hypothetical protein
MRENASQGVNPENWKMGADAAIALQHQEWRNLSGDRITVNREMEGIEMELVMTCLDVPALLLCEKTKLCLLLQTGSHITQELF